jgi:hypothetical protein
LNQELFDFHQIRFSFGETTEEAARKRKSKSAGSGEWNGFYLSCINEMLSRMRDGSGKPAGTLFAYRGLAAYSPTTPQPESGEGVGMS